MRTDPGEQVLFRGHPCWQSMFAFHIKSLLAAILAGVIAGLASRASAGHVQTGWVTLAVVGVFALTAGLGLLRRNATTYTITDRRLIVEYGWLGRDFEQTGLDRVQDVSYSQTVRQRVLRMGSVHFGTAAGLGYDLCFRGVARPRELVRTLDRVIRAPEHAGHW